MFTVAAAQTHSMPGDIAQNVRSHVNAARVAAQHGVNLVLFPELSLTGYEPMLAADSATTSTNRLLAPLQQICDESGVTLVAGCPIESGQAKPFLGAFVFTPQQRVEVYRKRFVHSSEEPYFLSGNDVVVCEVREKNVGIAICADIHNPTHSRDASAAGADVYAAGVAITPGGIEKAEAAMADSARQYKMAALMANYASSTGGFEMAGRSAIWNETGRLIARGPASGAVLVVAAEAASGWREAAVVDLSPQ